MKHIQINASRNYEVLIGRNLLKDAGKWIANVLKPCKLCIITDDTVAKLYAEPLHASLKEEGFELCQYVFAHGELSKNVTTYSQILEYMASENLTRTDAVVALGGGVTGDMAGFAAASYLRGIPFIQIPTTLLAAVDSSVGGKTGVNLESGKNLVGAFWQPSLVLCDCDTFKSLSYDLMLDGISEAIKYGAIVDSVLFDFIAQEDIFSDSVLEQITAHCVRIKSEVVEEDEKETGRRQLLNFGHTVGHAIEKCSHYTISHGHAVAIGMLIAARAAFKLGYSKENCAPAIEESLKKYRYPLHCPYTAKELAAVALNDKKRSGQEITLVLPSVIGECYLQKTKISELEHFIAQGLSE
ncbi:3-dehydroquinate synthase [Clostridium aminobutyricum]|uniref:3-dehydroquinate synthase n=1 Tax=Clostridium aminobutyricum TaxID=33953 RepID=A0A939IKD4_CLOAM|nr:3-dehydroquinate synthase [Clostridium aminobutyricum]MBN7774494.1 3-dehydroquinate synthase [Clostridium aminobutyricum]